AALAGVDALPDRTRRVAALQRQRRYQQVRQRVEHDELNNWRLALRLGVLLMPAIEPGQELLRPVLDGLGLQPCLDALLLEAEEAALAAVLDRRQPGDVASQGGHLGANLQLAINAGGGRLEAGEADLSHHLAQAVDQYDLVHGIGPGLIPVLARPSPAVER